MEIRCAQVAMCTPSPPSIQAVDDPKVRIDCPTRKFVAGWELRFVVLPGVWPGLPDPVVGLVLQVGWAEGDPFLASGLAEAVGRPLSRPGCC